MEQPSYEQIALIITALVGFFGGIGGLVTLIRGGRLLRAQNAKTEAEAASAFAAAGKMVADQNAGLRRIIINLEKKLDDRDKLIEEWQNGIEILVRQMLEERIKPKWTPKKSKIKFG
jgi:hypothetical protein